MEESTVYTKTLTTVSQGRLLCEYTLYVLSLSYLTTITGLVVF